MPVGDAVKSSCIRLWRRTMLFNHLASPGCHASEVRHFPESKVRYSSVLIRSVGLLPDLAHLRLDGDLYEATMGTLKELYAELLPVADAP
jgi:hypothetical protein